jgi:hypothetical protein
MVAARSNWTIDRVAFPGRKSNSPAGISHRPGFFILFHKIIAQNDPVFLLSALLNEATMTPLGEGRHSRVGEM